MPDRPDPEIDPADESDWLYDSSRAYMEQLDCYKRHKEGTP